MTPVNFNSRIPQAKILETPEGKIKLNGKRTDINDLVKTIGITIETNTDLKQLSAIQVLDEKEIGQLEGLQKTIGDSYLISSFETLRKISIIAAKCLLSNAVLSGGASFILELLPSSTHLLTAESLQWSTFLSSLSIDSVYIGITCKIAAMALEWFKNRQIKKIVINEPITKLVDLKKFSSKIPQIIESMDKFKNLLNDYSLSEKNPLIKEHLKKIEILKFKAKIVEINMQNLTGRLTPEFVALIAN